MRPVPVLLSDSLAAAQRRAVPALRAQEHQREADFARLLRDRDGEGEVGGELTRTPEEAAEGAAESHESASAEDQSAEGTADQKTAGADRTDAARADETSPESDVHIEQETSSQTREVGAVGNLPVEQQRPEQPITIRSFNTQLLHEGLRLDLDPRALLTRTVHGPAGLRSDGLVSAEPRGGATLASVTRSGLVRESNVHDESPSGSAVAAGSGQARTAEASDTRQAAPYGSTGTQEGGSAPSRVASVSRESPTSEAVRAAMHAPVVGVNARTPDIASATPLRSVDHHGGGFEGAARPAVSAVSGTSGGQGQSGLGGSNGERSAAAGRGGHRATTDEPSSAFKQQVLRGLGAAVAQVGKGAPNELVLRLQPGDLGQLKVRVSMDAEGRGITARFEVSSKEAQRLVDGSLEDLRASLESRGLGVGELEVRMATRERPVSDPLGLITGTPYAERSADHPRAALTADTQEHSQAFTDGGGAMTGQEPDGSADGGQHGPEARMERGPGSTDAPQSSLNLDEPAAERLLGPTDEAGAISLGRGEDGVLRLMVDAVA